MWVQWRVQNFHFFSGRLVVALDMDSHQIHQDALQGGPRPDIKWGYNPYEWPYKWVNRVLTLFKKVMTPFLTGDGGPPCSCWWSKAFTRLSAWTSSLFFEAMNGCTLILKQWNECSMQRFFMERMMVRRHMFPFTPWKIKGWNLKISLFEKEKQIWTNLHFWGLTCMYTS